MKNTTFHHALKIDHDLCIGCANCMRVCPTEAIRVSQGKAILKADRCIDCGECYRHCPVNGIIIEQDDLEEIHHFKHRVALVPSVFSGQFPEEISAAKINESLQELGFTEVFEVENAVEPVKAHQNRQIDHNMVERPAISTFCPAIVRLIQVKFPSLIPNLLTIKTPLDISAMYYKKILMDRGIPGDEIGLFYVTQCAAKIAAIKSPVGEEDSPINGVINMDYLYNRVYSIIKKNEDKPAPSKAPELTRTEILWSLTNGEKDHTGQRSLAIDGIHNVIAFLEKVENEEMKNIDFLELRACDESCAGGVLTSGNRFLTVERMKKQTAIRPNKHNKSIYEYQDYLSGNIMVGPFEARPSLNLDTDMAKAIRKMKRVQDIMERLPRVDCTLCGAPSCRALAEDIVQNKARIEHCIFIQKRKEQKEQIGQQESLEILKSIWGKPKLDKNR